MSFSDVMVLNEIIEQAGRQSRASDQNGMSTSLNDVASVTTLSCALFLFSKSMSISCMCFKLCFFKLTKQNTFLIL